MVPKLDTRGVRRLALPARLLVAVLLLVAALGALGCGSSDDSEGGGRQDGGVSTVAAGTPGEGKSLRYAVVGDSNSNGEAAGPDGAADPEGVAWPAQLARKLTADGVAVDLVANPAITGATIEQATAEELAPFKAARPDVATLMIGNNDWVAQKTPEDFRAQFKALLAEVVKTTGGPSASSPSARPPSTSPSRARATPTGATPRPRSRSSTPSCATRARPPTWPSSTSSTSPRP